VLATGSAAALLGLAAVVGAAVLTDAPRHDASVFPLVARGVEEFGRVSLELLFIVGLGVGLFRGASPLLTGLCTMAAFPLISLLEIAIDPTSHSLVPIEWFIYLVESLPGIAGAYAAHWIRRTLAG
jgi:hypothetical protein